VKTPGQMGPRVRTCHRCGAAFSSSHGRGRRRIYCSIQCQSAASSARKRKNDNPNLMTLPARNERFAERVWREKIIPELAQAGRGPIDSGGNRLNPSIMHGGNKHSGGGLGLIPRRRGTINGLNESKAPEASGDSTRSIYVTRKVAENPLERDPTFIEHLRLHATAVSAASADVVRDVLEDWVRGGFVSLAEVQAQSAILPQAWVEGPFQRLAGNNRHAQGMKESRDSSRGT
jgi:hypothetical protein